MDSEDSALEWNRTAFSCFFDNWFLFDWFSFFDAALRAADFDPSEPIPYLEKKYINRSFHFKKPELCSIEFYLAIRSHFRFGLLTDTIIRHQKRTSFIFSFCCWDGRDLWEIRTDWSGRRPTSDGPIRRFFRFDFFLLFSLHPTVAQQLSSILKKKKSSPMRLMFATKWLRFHLQRSIDLLSLDTL